MTHPKAYYHDEHRDVAVAIAIANNDPDTDLVVHKQYGTVDYVLSAVEVKFIQDQMRKALEESK